jgi:alcohol dehydrogenase (cytochrome c)
MGYKFDAAGNKIENGISGTTNATWSGDLWKTAAQPPGWAAATTRRRVWPTSAPATRHRGTATCAPATTCTRARRWRSMWTGQIKWHFQGTPNDGWDYDGVNEFVTFDMGGKRMGGKADRNGFFYVLDANTGKFERGFPFVNKITWAKGLDANGKPIFDPAQPPGRPDQGCRRQEG